MPTGNENTNVPVTRAQLEQIWASQDAAAADRRQGEIAMADLAARLPVCPPGFERVFDIWKISTRQTHAQHQRNSAFYTS